MAALLTALKDRSRQLGGHAVVGLSELPRTEVDGPGLSGTVIHFLNDDCRR